MLSFKLPMKKYLTLIYITLSVMTFAQFQDNVFEKDRTVQQQSELSNSAQVESNGSAEEGNPSSFGNGMPDPGDQEEGPGNPGEPVPIDGYVPLLIIGGLTLMVYYQRRNKKINI